MKTKILLIALLAFAMNAKAQITLEHKYDNASLGDASSNQLIIVNFPVSGDKYVRIRYPLTIDIYNLNHSLFKSISMAGFPPSYNMSFIYYISENLFSTDSKIAFMYVYADSNSVYNTLFYNEDGTLIFRADSVYPYAYTPYIYYQEPICNTTNGTKMILNNVSNGQANVYSLPGTYSSGIQEANNNLIALQKQGGISNPYPNPNNNSTKIDYELPQGINEGEIVFYNLQGMEVKRFKVDRTFNTLLISTNDLAAGTYYYQLQTSAQNSEGKKMVVIK